MLARRGIRSRRPQQSLVEGPSTDHDDRRVGGLGCFDGRGDPGYVVRPQLASLSVLELD